MADDCKNIADVSKKMAHVSKKTSTNDTFLNPNFKKIG
jgi:hypothetical protein